MKEKRKKLKLQKKVKKIFNKDVDKLGLNKNENKKIKKKKLILIAKLI